MPGVQICPECGGEERGTKCLCGYHFPRARNSVAEELRERQGRNPALAVVPAVILVAVAGMLIADRSTAIARVSALLTPGNSRTIKLNCVETYGVTLQSSEFYEREGLAGALRPRNAPKELATVVRGMARNNCGKPLTNIRIKIDVRDDAHKKGSAWANISRLGIGEAKSFERAWTGRVISYKVVEVR